MKGNKMFAGLVAGAAAGTAVGLLLAPKPSKESRHIVGARAGEISHQAGRRRGPFLALIRQTVETPA